MAKTRTRTRPQAAAQTTLATTRTGKLSKARMDLLKARFENDEYLYAMAVEIDKIGVGLSRTAIQQRHKIGSLFREIKGRRKENGIKAVCSAVDITVQVAYDTMSFSERITEAQLEQLLASEVNWTTMRTLAQISDKSERNALIKRIAGGETLTTKEIQQAAQQKTGKRSKGGRPVHVPTTPVKCADKLALTSVTAHKTLSALTNSLVDQVSELSADSVTDAMKDQLNEAYRKVKNLSDELDDDCDRLRSLLDNLGAPAADLDADLDADLESDEEGDEDDELGDDDVAPGSEDALAHAEGIDDDDEDDEGDEDDAPPRSARLRTRQSPTERIANLGD